MQKCNFNKVPKHLYGNRPSAWMSPVNLLYIFRTTFLGTALEGCFGIYKVANIVVVICCLHAVFA